MLQEGVEERCHAVTRHAVTRRAQVLAVIAVGLLLPTVLRPTPLRGDPRPPCFDTLVETQWGLECWTGPNPPGRGASERVSLWMGRRLDLNQATATSLTLIPGIGNKLAGRLVADREARGPFPSVEATQRVRGIGPRLATRLGAYTEVRGATDDTPAAD